jgi:hypothetical protein
MTEFCRLICKSKPVVKSVAFCGGSAVHMLVGQGRAFCELMPAGRVAGKFGTFDYNSLILHLIHAAVSFKRIQIRLLLESPAKSCSTVGMGFCLVRDSSPTMRMLWM